MENEQGGDSLVYFHSDASLPPPGHVEYEIHLSADMVELRYWPNYPSFGCPEFNISYPLTAEEAAGRIAAAFHMSCFVSQVWEDNYGASSDSVTGIYRDQAFIIPPGITGGPVLALFAVLKALIPEAGWQQAAEHRKAYLESL
jgi:hypothetical protein